MAPPLVHRTHTHTHIFCLQILAVKETIASTQGSGHDVDCQQLILQGKILKDDQTVASLNLAPTAFFVLFVRPKRKEKKEPPQVATTAAAATATATTTASGDAAASAPSPAAATAATTATTTTPIPPATTTATATAPGAAVVSDPAFLAGPALQEAINNICEMGFPREMVQKAMRAAFNNPDRAVEYLTSGTIPEEESRGGPEAGGAAPAMSGGGGGGDPSVPAAAAAATAPTPATTGDDPNDHHDDEPLDIFRPTPPTSAGDPTGSPADALRALEEFRNMPQLPAIRQVLASNPELLPAILQEIARTNPALMPALMANPGVLQELLTGMPAGEMTDEDMEGMGPEGMMGDEEGQHVIQLEPEEIEAVQRLEGLGFPRDLCIEAYLLCDRNEELAANYLLENGGMD